MQIKIIIIFKNYILYLIVQSLSIIFENIVVNHRINKKYDYIISNPPIRVGKETLYKILFGAREHLKDDGSLYFVINKEQGAKSVARDLEEIYQVSIIDKNKGFYIIKCKNKTIY